MLNHVVLFSFEGFASHEVKQQHLERTRQELEALPALIPALRALSAVLNENPSEAFDLMLTATVDSLDTLPEYATHPEHVRVVDEYIRPYLKARASVDFTLNC